MSWIQKQVPLKGLFDSYPSDMIPEGYASQALNVRFKFGAISNRFGTTQISTISTKPRWIGRFTNDLGVIYTLLLTETSLYRLVGSTWTIIGGAAFTGTGYYGIAMGLGRIFITRPGMGGVFYWDGDTSNSMVQLTDSDSAFGAPGSNVPEAYFLEFFNNRLFLGRPNESKTVRIRWSTDGVSGNWNTATTGGFLDLYDDLAEPITGIRNLAGRLTVYKRRSIIDVMNTGLTTPNPTHISEVRVRGLGCVAPYTLISTGQEHIFLGDGSIYTWDGSQIRDISKPIQRSLRQQLDSSKFNLYFAGVNVEEREYYLALQSGIVYVYDYARDIWTTDKYPQTSTVQISAIGSTDINQVVSNWSGAPNPIVGTWTQHSESWFDTTTAGQPALLGGGPGGSPLGTTFSTFYMDQNNALDYDASSPSQVVYSKTTYLEEEDRENQTVVMTLHRMLLRYQENDNSSIGVNILLSPATARFITVGLVPKGYTFVDCGDISGDSLLFAWMSNGAVFKWKSYAIDTTLAGQLLP